jgi:hypothetical protein
MSIVALKATPTCLRLGHLRVDHLATRAFGCTCAQCPHRDGNACQSLQISIWEHTRRAQCDAAVSAPDDHAGEPHEAHRRRLLHSMRRRRGLLQSDASSASGTGLGQTVDTHSEADAASSATSTSGQAAPSSELRTASLATLRGPNGMGEVLVCCYTMSCHVVTGVPTCACPLCLLQCPHQVGI